jgi:hypothetical protein
MVLGKGFAWGGGHVVLLFECSRYSLCGLGALKGCGRASPTADREGDTHYPKKQVNTEER